METIRKKICFDKLISHRNGISPYIQKDDDDTNIKYVESIASESNYGMFPCDFVLNYSEYQPDNETGLNTIKTSEISRLKYLDTLRWYNNSSKILKSGTIIKRFDYEYYNQLSLSGTSVDSPLDNCGISYSSVTNSELIETSLWAIDDTNEKSIFDCYLIDASFLVKRSDGLYEYNNDNTLKYKEIIENSGSSQSDISEEDIIFIEKMNTFVVGTGDIDVVSSYNGTLFSMDKTTDRAFVIENYDEYTYYDNKWNSWWSGNCSSCTEYSGGIWESFVFDSGYTAPSCLTFVYDFEKYILGKIRVPEIYNNELIEGSKVPNNVFYLNYIDYLNWFNNNSEYLDSNEDIQREWNKRGGDNFKAFLENVSTNFISAVTVFVDKSLTYFDFASPNVEIDLSLEDDCYTEFVYAPYEYSVGPNGELVNSTIEYEKGDDNKIESALTPTFVDFGDYPIEVESKLNTLYTNDIYYINDSVYGVFEEFEHGGQMFKCVFLCGSTVNSGEKIIRCSSGTVEYFTKSSEDEWTSIKAVDIKEHENGVIREEILPKTHYNSYQVVGIKEISSSVTSTEEVNINEETEYSDDGKLKIVSSITNYNKYITKNYEWCECIKEQVQHPCGDGEDGDFSINGKYRNLLLLSCVPNAVEDSSIGKTYYYMIKYDNGYTNIGLNNSINKEINPKALKLPLTFEKRNIESYDGEFSDIVKYDKIIAVNVDDNVKTVEYVIGATEGEDINTSGIHYIDSYYYSGNTFIDTVVDGYYKAKILYEKISPATGNAYSEDFNAYRNYIPSKITGMEIGTQWSAGTSIRTYLYTDDSYDNLVEYPKTDVNIMFNRGNAAAWEHHFKLSECNTFEDLQNIKNNYFNL